MHGNNRIIVEKISAKEKPLVSIIVSAYNEASILYNNLKLLCSYMQALESSYRWEIIVVDDGSSDETGKIAYELAQQWKQIKLLNHPVNFGLGQALQYAFSQSKGDYVITLDIDLSYDTDHIQKLLSAIKSSKAKIVLASPYMKGGKLSNVPWFRRVLSIGANRFLSIMSPGHYSTLTGMVRVYDGEFIRSLDLRSTGMNIMPEIIYKAGILQARIDQMPAHLDWGEQKKQGTRRSSMKILKQIASTLLSGFLFRPVIFFIFPGALLLGFSIYVFAWMGIHFFEIYSDTTGSFGVEKATRVLATAYKLYPHTYLIGLLSLMLSLQLIGLGVQSLQNKNYFEELYHIASRLLREDQKKKEESS